MCALAVSRGAATREAERLPPTTGRDSRFALSYLDSLVFHIVSDIWVRSRDSVWKIRARPDLDSYLRYVSSDRFGRSIVPTHSSTGHVAFQNTFDRPKPDASLHPTLKTQRNSQRNSHRNCRLLALPCSRSRQKTVVFSKTQKSYSFFNFLKQTRSLNEATRSPKKEASLDRGPFFEREHSSARDVASRNSARRRRPRVAFRRVRSVRADAWSSPRRAARSSACRLRTRCAPGARGVPTPSPGSSTALKLRFAFSTESFFLSLERCAAALRSPCCPLRRRAWPEFSLILGKVVETSVEARHGQEITRLRSIRAVRGS